MFHSNKGRLDQDKLEEIDNPGQKKGKKRSDNKTIRKALSGYVHEAGEKKVRLAVKLGDP
jgi:hypothetical protein